MLEINALCAGYPGKEVLHQIRLTACQGQITAIIGPNGCGKSTLLKSICAILRPTRGQISLNGQDLLQLPQNLLAQNVAYLSQNRQAPDITVSQLVLHGRFPYLQYPRRYRREDYEITQRVMAQLQIAHWADTPLNRLSGGQQQKAYIAMALAQDTQVLLLDEPTTYLDVGYQLQVLELAQMLARQGKHILMVIHDLSYALEFADQVVVMQDGAVRIQGTPEQVYRSGLLDPVFGVHVDRLPCGGTYRYFCQRNRQKHM